MTAPSDQKNRELRASICMDARMDATTRAKVDDLATLFHQTRAAVLRSIIHWGLQHGQAIPLEPDTSPHPVRHLHVSVDAALQEQVVTAAAAARGTLAAWVRQITLTDFPISWQEAHAEARSHNSHRYTRFMLRLDAPSGTKLQQLVNHFGVSRAAVIRQLIAIATLEVFPRSWHTRAAEHRAQTSR